MKRGEIRYICGRNRLGTYDHKNARPAVIVSANEIIEASETVEVVYLTTHPWNDLPTHVTLNSSGVESVALCERVAFADKEQVGELLGECTAFEMAAIEAALLRSLGITPAEKTEPHNAFDGSDLVRIHRICCERDVYERIIDKLLEAKR